MYVSKRENEASDLALHNLGVIELRLGVAVRLLPQVEDGD
jgi:hypothetical protein